MKTRKSFHKMPAEGIEPPPFTLALGADRIRCLAGGAHLSWLALQG